MMTEAEMGAMCLQAKGPQGLPATTSNRETQERILLESLRREPDPADTWIDPNITDFLLSHLCFSGLVLDFKKK